MDQSTGMNTKRPSPHQGLFAASVAPLTALPDVALDGGNSDN